MNNYETTLRHQVVINGVRTPVLESGPQESAEAVVFVHGNPGAGADWAGLVAAVGSFTRALAPDMPGFGRADKPNDFPYTVPGYAAHLGALIDTMGLRRVHLVLHDFGGPWGLSWAAQRPEMLASMTLINTGVLPGYRWHYMARLWRTPGIGELVQAMTTRASARLLLKHGNPRGLPRDFIDRMYDDYDAATRRAVLRLYRATPHLGGLAREWSSILRPLDVPALVIWGARDPYIGVEYAPRQREAFPSAEIVVLPDSGHWPYADNPIAVRDTLVPFLERQQPGAGA